MITSTENIQRAFTTILQGMEPSSIWPRWARWASEFRDSGNLPGVTKLERASRATRRWGRSPRVDAACALLVKVAEAMDCNAERLEIGDRVVILNGEWNGEFGTVMRATCAGGAGVRIDGDQAVLFYFRDELAIMKDHGVLIDYQTGEDIRPATASEREASDKAGPEGVILVGSRSCYVA